MQGLLQAQLREVRAEVRGLKEAARVSPQAVGTIASRQTSMFSKALTELDGKLDDKLAPLVAEQKRLASSVDAVFKLFQVLAVVLPITVAFWGILSGQAGGVDVPIHPRVRMMGYAALFAVAAPGFLFVLLFLRKQNVSLWPQ